jgi:hypothetical protein
MDVDCDTNSMWRRAGATITITITIVIIGIIIIISTFIITAVLIRRITVNRWQKQ